jgi:hypothetical protein
MPNSSLWSNIPKAAPVEEEKVDNIHAAIKSVIRKSQINNGKWQ